MHKNRPRGGPMVDIGKLPITRAGSKFWHWIFQPLELIYKYFCKGYRNIHIYYFGVSARLDKCEFICTLIERLADWLICLIDCVGSVGSYGVRGQYGSWLLSGPSPTTATLSGKLLDTHTHAAGGTGKEEGGGGVCVERCYLHCFV